MVLFFLYLKPPVVFVITTFSFKHVRLTIRIERCSPVRWRCLRICIFSEYMSLSPGYYKAKDVCHLSSATSPRFFRFLQEWITEWSEKNIIAPFLPLIPETRNLWISPKNHSFFWPKMPKILNKEEVWWFLHAFGYDSLTQQPSLYPPTFTSLE